MIKILLNLLMNSCEWIKFPVIQLKNVAANALLLQPCFMEKRLLYYHKCGTVEKPLIEKILGDA